MSAEVVVETRRHGQWQPLWGIGRNDPLGSLQSLEPDGRIVVVFGWRDGRAGVWRTLDGQGIEVADEMTRALYGPAANLKLLADLTNGPYERNIFTRRGVVASRWSVQAR